MNDATGPSADGPSDHGPLAADAATGAAAPKRSRAWLGWAFRALTIVLAVWVLWSVSWNDSVELPDGTRVIGEFVGDVPRAPAGDATVTLRLPDGTTPSWRTADLAVETIDGEKYAKVNDGVLRIVGRSDKVLLLAGFLLFGAVSQFGVWRWWLLLRAMGIRLSFWTAHRLTFIGFFFNNVIPGATGGDVVKAVYVARGTDKRAAAAMTVLLDRLLGLLALALIALVVLLIERDRPQFAAISTFVMLFLGAGAVFAFVFFSGRVRSILRVESWLYRLPGGRLIKKADEALYAWRSHVGTMVWAVVLSFGNQLGIQVMMWTIAAGLHVTTRDGGAVSPLDYMVVLPVAFIVSAIPAMPGGWGTRELAFAVCLHFVGVDRGPAVALSVMAGLVQLAWSIPGGVYFFLARASGEFRGAPGAPEPSDAAGPASA